MLSFQNAGCSVSVCWAGRLLENLELCEKPIVPRAAGGLTKGEGDCGAPGRRWSAAPVCVAGAVSELLERVAARLVAASPRLLSVRQVQYLKLLEKVICGFGVLLYVNCVRGSCANRRCEKFALVSSRHAFGSLLHVHCSCANRRCENFALMSCWHAGLAACCV